MTVDIPIHDNPRVPPTDHPFHHITDLQVRFNDIDMIGHVNNSIYLQYMDLGKTRYFEAVMPRGVNWRHINVVIVNINCDFFSPAYIHEPLAVVTRALSISERSFRMEQRVINRSTGDVKCLCRTVMAGFDPRTATGAPIDPEWVTALEAFEERTLR